MSIKTLNRPAKISSSQVDLDREFRAARWIYHRLLDFEDSHQKVLDETAELVAPRILRVGRIVAILKGRVRRLERSSDWCPRPRTELRQRLQQILLELRKQRNADPRWKEALKWADTAEEGAPQRGKARRRKDETAEQYEQRCASRRNTLTRREAWRHQLYHRHVSPVDEAELDATEREYRASFQGPFPEIYWGTWNALLKSVDQARKAVLQARKEGLPAKWRRPRWSDSATLVAEPGGFRIVKRDKLWWTIEMRLHEGWVRFRAKGGNWHAIPNGAKFKTCKLTRVQKACRWKYSVSLAVDGMQVEHFPGTGVVALDWGHREHGHDLSDQGLRAFTWLGDDGRRGEILLPIECRQAADLVKELKSRADSIYGARRQPEPNRHVYRRRLLRSGVRTEEEGRWLEWEYRYEQRIARATWRIANLRQEAYLVAVRQLRQHYAVFVTEDEPGKHHRELDTREMTRHRKRENRDMVARYLFLTICERLGAEVLTVPSRNTTRECPDCGELAENGPELLIACPGCGQVRDKDYGAAQVILRRGQEDLANRAASA